MFQDFTASAPLPPSGRWVPPSALTPRDRVVWDALAARAKDVTPREVAR